MAKSLRAKTKRAYRAKKREEGVYAATHAARLNRLNAKLVHLTTRDASEFKEKDEDEEEEEEKREGWEDQNGMEPETQGEANNTASAPDAMELDGGVAKRISTHGPRNSRREQWRLSKGMTSRPRSKVNFRHKGPPRRHSGHSKSNK
ncbi:hypothetical protein JAAARDRAFT_28452 [Jaapia argillacea MUCL 33604]|uniref:DUF2423 domain-containing protein n=1 Tax=Jaapia argillacea MUCL 33604 TaxID=933084 RepID=A0A067QCV9_9AGAM|nr:hypothetical protein JAAARDRAFT_28452 [Jaapia argillacea MUCL 33604]